MESGDAGEALLKTELQMLMLDGLPLVPVSTYLAGSASMCCATEALRKIKICSLLGSGPALLVKYIHVCVCVDACTLLCIV